MGLEVHVRMSRMLSKFPELNRLLSIQTRAGSCGLHFITSLLLLYWVFFFSSHCNLMRVNRKIGSWKL